MPVKCLCTAAPYHANILALLLGVAIGIAGVDGGRAVAAPAHAAKTCAPGALAVTIATDRRSYGAGQPVTITVTVRNDSKTFCAVPTGSCLPQVLITGRNGSVVWNRAETQVVCVYGKPRALRPGGATARVVKWNRLVCAGRDLRRCPGTPAKPAQYRATATWSSLKRASTGFVIRS